MLIDKTVTFKSAHDKARMQDPAVLRERAKVQLIPDAELERLMPRREAVVGSSAHRRQGPRESSASERIDRNRRQSYDSPGNRRQSARSDYAGTGNVTLAGNSSTRVFDLEQVKDVRDLRPLLQRA